MNIRVKPAYGFGGFRLTDGNVAVDVPPDFSFDAAVLEPGEPFISVLGLLTAPSHPLSGQWIALWQSTRGEQPTYNLRAFRERPADPWKDRPDLTGFAVAEPISN